MSINNLHFRKPNRSVDTLFVHCSASSNPAYGVAEIARDHLRRGFTEIGYHWVILFDGSLVEGRSIEKNPAAQKGHNLRTLAVCLQGLKEEDFTEEQFATLRDLVDRLNSVYPPKGLRIRGHREVANKTCPVFDYRKVLSLNAQGYREKSVDSQPASVHNAPRQRITMKDEIAALQRKHGLEDDGVIGPVTWKLIKTLIGDRP